jgi:hypothetical protein
MDPLQSMYFGGWPELDSDDTPMMAPPKIQQFPAQTPVTIQMPHAWPVSQVALMPPRAPGVVSQPLSPPVPTPSPFAAQWTQPIPLNRSGRFARTGIATASAFE